MMCVHVGGAHLGQGAGQAGLPGRCALCQLTLQALVHPLLVLCWLECVWLQVAHSCLVAALPAQSSIQAASTIKHSTAVSDNSICAGYEHEDHAAEAHDVAALRCKGITAKTNFDMSRQASKLAHSPAARLLLQTALALLLLQPLAALTAAATSRVPKAGLLQHPGWLAADAASKHPTSLPASADKH